MLVLSTDNISNLELLKQSNPALTWDEAGDCGRVGEIWQGLHRQLILVVLSRPCQHAVLPCYQQSVSSQLTGAGFGCYSSWGPSNFCLWTRWCCLWGPAAGIMGHSQVRSLWSHQCFLRGMSFLRKELHSHWVIVFPCKAACSVVKSVCAGRWMELWGDQVAHKDACSVHVQSRKQVFAHSLPRVGANCNIFRPSGWLIWPSLWRRSESSVGRGRAHWHVCNLPG